MPNLLQGLRTMSLTKSVPRGLNPQEWERTKLRKPPPAPYIPEKDKVQEEVAKLRNLQIKTSLEKDTTLNFPVWHENGTREAFLMHVTAVLDAMKKRGHFKDYDRAQKAYEEATKAAESAEAGLALLKGTSAGTTSKRKKKALAKAKEAAKEALAKAQETKPETKEAENCPM
jgi:valyl-tRNA synthetase